MWSDLIPWPLFPGQTVIAKLKSVYNLLIIGPRGLQCETNLQEIIGWESSDLVRLRFSQLTKSLVTWIIFHLEYFVHICYSSTFGSAIR